MDHELIDRARELARELHDGQTRKKTDLDYFEGHLEPVAELVRASGGTDVQIAAAYLHDAAEDQGGQATLDVIADRIGDGVAVMVEHLSDSLTDTSGGEVKAGWASRKRSYLRGLAEAPSDVLEVSVADKLHNCRSILDDHSEIGSEVWARFNETRPAAQLWYYGALATVFADRLSGHPLTDELVGCVDELRDQVRILVPDLDDQVAEIAAAFDAPTQPSGKRYLAIGRPASFEEEDLDRFAEAMVAKLNASIEQDDRPGTDTAVESGESSEDQEE